MKSSELQNDSYDGNESETEHDCGKPLLVEWTDSAWFQVWLRLARHEEVQAA